jgi:mRNA interferase MazF
MTRGDLLLVSLPASNNREQSGVRPALAVQTTSTKNPMLIVAPITSNLNALRFLFTFALQPTIENGLTEPSVVMLFQIRAIDKNRIIKKIGQISTDEMKHIDAEIRKMLEV